MIRRQLFSAFCDVRNYGDVYQSATWSTLEQAAVTQPVFAVDQTTGRITTTMTLDREQTPVYQLTALAIDSRNTSMSASANVTIYVADKNDNEPVVVFPSPSNYTVQVMNQSINQSINQQILRWPK